MRIAIAVEGTRGDVHPQIALAESLAAAGHRVRICAPPDFADAIRARGIEFLPLGENVEAFLRDNAGAVHSRGPRFFREMARYAERSLATQFRVLPDAVAGMDFVIAAGTVLVASSAAELHGIPYRCVVYTPAVLPSPEHTPALLPLQLRARSVNQLLWRLTEAAVDRLAGARVNRYRAALGLPPLRRLVRHVLSACPIVAVDRPLAPVPEDCAIRYDQIRCLHPLEGEPLPHELEEFLAAGPPPVYLGFGSMPDPDPAETTRHLLDALARLGCRALISKGWAGLADGPLPRGILAVGAVSHARLFPRVAAVVHHGGSGTTHAAARAGVPQIVVPHALDQFYFADRVAALGVAPGPLPRTRLTVGALAEAMRRTLAEPSFRERAARLAERLAELGPTAADPERILRGASVPSAGEGAAPTSPFVSGRRAGGAQALTPA